VGGISAVYINQAVNLFAGIFDMLNVACVPASPCNNSKLLQLGSFFLNRSFYVNIENSKSYVGYSDSFMDPSLVLYSSRDTPLLSVL